MTPQEAHEAYYEAMRTQDWHSTSGNAPIQAEMQLKVWETVLARIRKDYEQELERLREENRAFRQTMMTTIERDAA